MAENDNGISEEALDSLSVAPNASNQERDPRQDAGQDQSIQKRLEKNPESEQARLDNGLDETMDGSDPVSITQPGTGEPAPSSGYDEDAERDRQG